MNRFRRRSTKSFDHGQFVRRPSVPAPSRVSCRLADHPPTRFHRVSVAPACCVAYAYPLGPLVGCVSRCVNHGWEGYTGNHGVMAVYVVAASGAPRPLRCGNTRHHLNLFVWVAVRALCTLTSLLGLSQSVSVHESELIPLQREFLQMLGPSWAATDTDVLQVCLSVCLSLCQLFSARSQSHRRRSAAWQTLLPVTSTTAASCPTSRQSLHRHRDSWALLVKSTGGLSCHS